MVLGKSVTKSWSAFIMEDILISLPHAGHCVDAGGSAEPRSAHVRGCEPGRAAQRSPAGRGAAAQLLPHLRGRGSSLAAPSLGRWPHCPASPGLGKCPI